MARKEFRTAAPFVPPRPTLPKLQIASQSCTGCDLYKNATQTVFGEGSNHARVLFIGEQPGDKEDVEGRPFVGPAGKLLDKALEAAGAGRTQGFVAKPGKKVKKRKRRQL